jgi:hypothetical protein
VIGVFVIHVSGGEKLRTLARAVRLISDDHRIIKNLRRRITEDVKPIAKEIRASAVERLPEKGGLGAWVADAKITTRVDTAGSDAGVFVRIGRNSEEKQSDIAAIDAGGVRHPLWGNRKHWYPQVVKPGFASSVLEGPLTDRVRESVLAAIDDAIAEVVHTHGL